MKERLTIEAALPRDWARATLVGRVWLPGKPAGPAVVAVRPDGAFALGRAAPTMSDLLNAPDPVALARGARARVGDVVDILANTAHDGRDPGYAWFLAPSDLQAIKAAGVTFVSSMLERVIEERARGDAARAEILRRQIVDVIGGDLRAVKPGSDAAARLKQVLIDQGAWSQYLEVGIGPDAEIFTKAQPMSAVGTGAEVGLHPGSTWNNPEPEIVLAAAASGKVVGATLGNDVNLRDFEGRSALLLGKAKDNNASCAIGPLIRLFDESFGIDDVRAAELALTVEGRDNYRLEGSSSMRMISRDPLDLAAQACGPTHQYPDGFMLFLGTMFAPTDDRGEPGRGFTHKLGDIVTVASPRLGALVNRVDHSDKVAPWTFGVGALMKNLAARGLL